MATITIIKKKYEGSWAIENVLAYCDRMYDYAGGYGIDGCYANSACSDMINIKNKFKKYSGKQLYRMIITVENLYDSNGNRLSDQLEYADSFVCSIARHVSNNIGKMGFQNCYFSKIVNNSHIQFHFVINTTSYVDGRSICSLKDVQLMVLKDMERTYPQFQWEANYINA